MNVLNSRYLVLGVSIIAVAIVLGTVFWTKLEPRRHAQSSTQNVTVGLDRYGAVPEFSLIERSGKRVELANLRGKIWVADFIYTACTDTCPLQSAEMAKLQEALGHVPKLNLVSFSVDPARDNPKVLSRYADRFKADPERWLFLTGDKQQVRRLAQEGFKLSAAPEPTAGGKDNGIILHSARFVLVDETAQIRGYYDSRDADALQRLRHDLDKLLRLRKE
jgi:protein SCO1/2